MLISDLQLSLSSLLLAAPNAEVQHILVYIPLDDYEPKAFRRMVSQARYRANLTGLPYMLKITDSVSSETDYATEQEIKTVVVKITRHPIRLRQRLQNMIKQQSHYLPF